MSFLDDQTIRRGILASDPIRYDPSMLFPPVGGGLGTSGYTRLWTQTARGTKLRNIAYSPDNDTILAIDQMRGDGEFGSDLISFDPDDGTFGTVAANMAFAQWVTQQPQMVFCTPELEPDFVVLRSWNLTGSYYDLEAARYTIGGTRAGQLQYYGASNTYQVFGANLDPTGRYLWAASEGSGAKRLYRRDIVGASSSFYVPASQARAGYIAPLSDGSCIYLRGTSAPYTLELIAADMTTVLWSHPVDLADASRSFIPGWEGFNGTGSLVIVDEDTGRFYMALRETSGTSPVLHIVSWSIDGTDDGTLEVSHNLGTTAGGWYKMIRDRFGGWWVSWIRSGVGWDIVRFDSSFTLVHQFSSAFPALDAFTDHSAHSSVGDIVLLERGGVDMLVVASWSNSNITDGVARVSAYSVD